MVSPRIAERVARDFKANVQVDVLELLESVAKDRSHVYDTDAGRERIHAAMLILARGNVDTLLHAASEAEMDWRDLLVAAGLEHDDWPQRVAAFLDARR